MFERIKKKRAQKGKKIMTLQIIPLGVGGAFSQKYYSTALLICAEDGTILVDCPHPIRKMLKEAAESRPVDIGDIDAVLISHLHADHVSGLEGLLFYSRFHLGRKATAAAHEKVLRRLWPHCLAAGMDSAGLDAGAETLRLEDYANIVELNEKQPVKAGGFKIACRQTLHHVPTFAFKIFCKEGAVGFSADTAYDPSLIEWLSECDIIVHETNEGIHTPYEKLAALDEPLRKKMRLIHYPDDFDPATSAVEPLVQGRAVTVL
jgi:ribonuclease BN (tRNA processing enzyme)